MEKTIIDVAHLVTIEAVTEVHRWDFCGYVELGKLTEAVLDFKYKIPRAGMPVIFIAPKVMQYLEQLMLGTTTATTNPSDSGTLCGWRYVVHQKMSRYIKLRDAIIIMDMMSPPTDPDAHAVLSRAYTWKEMDKCSD